MSYDYGFRGNYSFCVISYTRQTVFALVLHRPIELAGSVGNNSQRGAVNRPQIAKRGSWEQTV
jgi:hypothetical protein